MKSLSKSLLLIVALQMALGPWAQAAYIKSPEADIHSFESYLRHRNLESLGSANTLKVFSGDRKKLYAAIDSLEDNPEQALSTASSFLSEHPTNADDIHFIEDLVRFYKNLRIEKENEVLKSLECKLAFNKPVELQEKKCLYSQVSTERIKKFIDEGGVLLIHEFEFNRANLPEFIFATNEKYYMSFISSTHSSYSVTDSLKSELENFKTPAILVSGGCDEYSLSSKDLQHANNYIYFSDNCVRPSMIETNSTVQWMKENKGTLLLASGLLVIVAGVYLKDKQIVFQNKAISF